MLCSHTHAHTHTPRKYKISPSILAVVGLSSSHIPSHNSSALLSVLVVAVDVVILSEDVPGRDPLFLLLPRRLLPLPGEEEEEEVHMVVLVSALRFFPPAGMGGGMGDGGVRFENE